MYKLIGKYGNDIVVTDDAKRKDKLIHLGYTLAEEKAPTQVKTDEKKPIKKAVKPKK